MASSSKIVNITNLKVACQHCNLRELCLPLGLEASDIQLLEKTIKRKRTLKKGEALYRSGDELRSLYAISRGSVKAVGLLEDGRIQITGFYLPGELLGMDAINADRHPCTVEALETTEVCEIPFAAIEDLARSIPGLQRQLLRIMSREIAHDEHQLMLLGRMTAEERLASYLLSLARRFRRLGAADTDLKLSMSRQDIGDYLGLALETVSRLFSRFQDEGLIRVQGREIAVVDTVRLEQIASGRDVERREAR